MSLPTQIQLCGYNWQIHPIPVQQNAKRVWVELVVPGRASPQPERRTKLRSILSSLSSFKKAIRVSETVSTTCLFSHLCSLPCSPQLPTLHPALFPVSSFIGFLLSRMSWAFSSQSMDSLHHCPHLEGPHFPPLKGTPPKCSNDWRNKSSPSLPQDTFPASPATPRSTCCQLPASYWGRALRLGSQGLPLQSRLLPHLSFTILHQ